MDANTSCWTVMVILAVLVSTLSSETWAKSVHHQKKNHHKHKTHVEAVEDKPFFTKKCDCRVETSDKKVLHNFKTIATYEFPESTCHQVHHKCRRACVEKLDLEGHMGDHISTKRGLHYCDAFGQVTPPGGVSLEAVWKATDCPHHKEERSKRHVKLCCGHTTVNLREETYAKVFGWNKDCKAQSFVIGK